MSAAEFERTVLGRTGLRVGRLGVSASYGVPTAAIERAFDEGVNYLYWGSRRTSAFAGALRRLSPRRDAMVLVVQSYSRSATLMKWSLERALRTVRFDYADVLLLGLWNKPVPARILDAALRLKQRGLARFLAVSTHRRQLVPQLAAPGSAFDVIHFRYNAAHSGAEQDIFPYLAADRAGTVAYTATSWGQLLKSKEVTAADCYRFVLTRPEIDVCMTGPSNAGQMDQALEALRLGPMTTEELERIRRVGLKSAKKSSAGTSNKG
ncbi:MAG: aldo/keto reductase [Acidobacteriota bacterium]